MAGIFGKDSVAPLTLLVSVVALIATVIGGVWYLGKNLPDRAYVDDQVKTTNAKLESLRSDLQTGIRTITCESTATIDIIEAKFQIQAAEETLSHNQVIIDGLTEREKRVSLSEYEKADKRQRLRDLEAQKDIRNNVQTQLNLLQTKIRPGGGCDAK